MDYTQIHRTLSETVIDTRSLEEIRNWLDDGDDTDEEDRALVTAIDELREDVTEWYDGNVLIRDDYFVEYAQETAEDLGAVDDSSRWPCDCIDWERAADELALDYHEVEFNGHTWKVRS